MEGARPQGVNHRRGPVWDWNIGSTYIDPRSTTPMYENMAHMECLQYCLNFLRASIYHYHKDPVSLGLGMKTNRLGIITHGDEQL